MKIQQTLEVVMGKKYMGEIILVVNEKNPVTELGKRLRNQDDYILFGLYNSMYDTVLEINEFRKNLSREIEKILVYEVTAYGMRNTVGSVDLYGVFTRLP